MALGAFVGIGFCLFITSPDGASANAAAIGQTTGGMTGPNPGYKITWTATDGECVSTGPGGTPSVPWEYPTTGESKGSATYAFGMASGGSGTIPQAAGPGSTSCAGTITATFTWDDDDPEKVIPPPPVVVLHEYAAGYATGETRDASSDIPQTGGYEEQYDILVEGERYEVINNPGPSFQRSVQPSAEATVPESTTPPLLAAFAGVAYEVATYPARIEFSGVIDPITDKSLIIGQRLTAKVSYIGIPPPFESSSYSWQIDSGLLPYAGYDETRTQNQKDDYSPPNADTTAFYVAKPKLNALVKCTVTTTGPALSFDVSDLVTVVEPTKSVTDEAMGEFMTIKWVLYGQPPQLVPQQDDIAPTEMKLLNPGKWGGYTLSGRLIDPGPPYTSDPAPSGLWNYTQLVTPDVWFEDSLGRHYGPLNNLKGLDGSFPYPKGRDPQGNPIPGDFHSAAPSASPFQFVDSPAVGPLDPPTFKAHWSGPFELYMMYKPPGVSTWTPRVKITWTANGECVKSGGLWSIPTNSSAPGSISDWYEHPEWERVHL